MTARSTGLTTAHGGALRTGRSAVAAAILAVAMSVGSVACHADSPAPAPSSVPSTDAAATTPAAPPSGASPVATTPVPPTQSGDVSSTAPSAANSTKPAVPMGSAAQPAKGISITLVDITAVEAKFRRPGEVAGPSIAITVQVANDTDRAVDLSSVIVAVLDSAGGACGLMSDTPSDPFTGKVSPDGTAKGVYVFRVDRDKRDPVHVTVDLGVTGQPTVSFSGTAS